MAKNMMHSTKTAWLSRGDTVPRNYVQSALRQVATELPRELRRLLEEYYVERAMRAGELPRMGEEVLLLCGDLFRIDADTMRRTSTPWACLYVNCLMIDDLIDVPGKYPPGCAMLVQHLADEGYRLLREVVGGEGVFWEQLQKYRLQSWQAITAEIRPPLCGGDCSPLDVALEQGKKAAMAKACAAALMQGSYGIALNERQEHGLDCLCAAVQLLDDIHDCREDHAVKRNNLLLTRGEELLAAPDASSRFWELDEQSLLCALLVSGAVCDAWSLAAELLEESLSALGGAGDSGTEVYFQSLAEKCRTSASHISSIISLNHRWATSMADALRDCDSSVGRGLTAGTGERLWRDLQIAYRRGPVAAN